MAKEAEVQDTLQKANDEAVATLNEGEENGAEKGLMLAGGFLVLALIMLLLLCLLTKLIRELRK